MTTCGDVMYLCPACYPSGITLGFSGEVVWRFCAAHCQPILHRCHNHCSHQQVQVTWTNY